jgi:predicted phage-related endonuclease
VICCQFDPNDDTSPMFWGTMLEPIVAAHYTKRTGNKVRRVNAVLQHPEHPWMLANVDREVVGSSRCSFWNAKLQASMAHACGVMVFPSMCNCR